MKRRPTTTLKTPKRRVTAAAHDLSAVHLELARAGCRVTQQRKAVVAEFARSRRYLTPGELHRRLSAGRHHIGLATIYRTLDVLERMGVASRAPEGHGEASYVFCPIAPHHHAVCVRCGKVADVPCGSGEGFSRTLAARLRFRLTDHRLEFYGLCSRCGAGQGSAAAS